MAACLRSCCLPLLPHFLAAMAAEMAVVGAVGATAAMAATVAAEVVAMIATGVAEKMAVVATEMAATAECEIFLQGDVQNITSEAVVAAGMVHPMWVNT
jgi:hypothetical protein